LPSVTLYYPANIPGTPGHNWADGIAMATPIAHKGVVAGAKVQAMTLLDLMMSPKLVADAKDYFVNVQTKTIKYRPLIAASDQPAIWLNAEKMAKYREEMRKFYYDPSKYDTYLQQLGIVYPTIPKITLFVGGVGGGGGPVAMNVSALRRPELVQRRRGSWRRDRSAY
jgi:aminobenzoyl-glutamate utilization protein B